MRMAATLTIFDRPQRYSVSLPATVRRDGVAIDAEILDLSISGFRAVVDADLAYGSEVRIGWAGGGTQHALVSRREGREYAFAFIQPLRPGEAEAANAVDNVVAFGIEEPAADSGPSHADAVAAPVTRRDGWPPAYRALAIVVAAGISWGIVGAVVLGASAAVA